MHPNYLKRGLAVAALACGLGLTSVASAAAVFTDTFTRSNSSTIGNSWSEASPGGGDVAIASNMLDILSNNGNDNGLSYATQAMSSFAAPFNPVLGNNPGMVSWMFNMQASTADLSGVESGEEAIAFVIAATSSDMTAANGYAVMWGGAGSTDPIRLVRFAGGLDANANITDMITATGASGTGGDPNNNYMSVKVTYDPSSNTFELFTRSDGVTAFADPTAGSFISAGTLVNSTYTSSTMTSIAAVGVYSGNNDHARFDNVTIDVVPEPATLGLAAIGALGLISRRRRA